MDLLPALLYFIVILLAYQNSEITLTNKRLIHRTGFVARAAGELPLSLSPQRVAIEARMVEAWSQGENPALSIVCNEVGCG